MRIGIDARFLSNRSGGLGRYTAELIINLLKIDSQTNYLLIVPEGEKITGPLGDLIASRASQVEMWETRARHYSLSEQFSLLKLLRDARLDLMHFTHFNHPLLYTKPFVVTIHDLTLSRFGEQALSPRQWLYRFVIADAIKRAKRIFVVSNFVKNEIVRAYHQPLPKFVTTYNAVDPAFQPITNAQAIARVATKYGIDRTYILYVGQIRAHKNLRRLIDAFRNFATNPKLAGQYQLVIAGVGRHYQAELEKRAEREIAEKSIIFTGFVSDEDLPFLYNGAKLFVFPSLSEGFGIPALEAMACNVPVIAARATATPEILGKAADYFDPFSIADIFSKMQSGLSDNRHRQELIRLGQDQVAKFSWEKLAATTLKTYYQVIGKTR